METYLRNNPGVRWSLIVVLLLCIFLEGMLIRDRVFGSDTTQNGDDAQPFGSPTNTPPSTTVQLACTVRDRVNMRTGPSTDFQVIRTLPGGTEFTALGRNNQVPWLAIRVNETGEQGWLSTRSGETELVTCDGDLQSLPEVDSPTAEAAPTETIPPEPTSTSAPNVDLREGNGPDLRAPRRTFRVILDGDLSEWAAVERVPVANVVFRPENWSSPEDLSGSVRATWDDEFLYLAAEVTDDAVVQESREDLLVRGDAVELFWDAELQGDFTQDSYNQDESQAVISPGNFANHSPSAWVYFSPAGNFRDTIDIGAARTDVGYNLEARLAWSSLGVNARETQLFGYALAFSDDDSLGSGEQETQMSTTPQTPFNHPIRWGNFILEP